MRRLFVAACFTLSLLAARAEDLRGLPNFHKVNDNLFRGGQPDGIGFLRLSQMGVKTVIDLRGGEHSEKNEEALVTAAGMRYVSIPMRGMSTPTDYQISSALKMMNNASAGPVFVHCRRGADRTGGVIACYRVEHDHWTGENALREARGLGMRWYQLAIQHYVMQFAAKTNNSPTPPLISQSVRQ